MLKIRANLKTAQSVEALGGFLKQGANRVVYIALRERAEFRRSFRINTRAARTNGALNSVNTNADAAIASIG